MLPASMYWSKAMSLELKLVAGDAPPAEMAKACDVGAYSQPCDAGGGGSLPWPVMSAKSVAREKPADGA